MKKKVSYKVGLERESLRMCNDASKISTKPHPKSLGDPLTNKIITIDFAESQLELATPIFSSNKKALHWIDMTMAYLMQNIDEEVLWPMSSPPPFDKGISIGTFGDSEEGRFKHLYRRGLKNRFGLEKQLLSGYHYNFSLQPSFFEEYKNQLGSSLPIKEFTTDCYLHIMRNFFRYGWIIPYFYGTTPFPFSSMEKDSFPFATSLRQSRYGYTNKIQEGLYPNYNSISKYVQKIKTYTKEVCPEYCKFGKDQISQAFLQIPNELYSFIRPKRIAKNGGSEIDALASDGIEYLEVRLLDINPLYRTGTSVETLTFIKNILLFCLYTPSPELSEDAFFQSQENFFMITERGLDPNLSLSIEGEKKSVSDWIDFILKKSDQTAPEIMPIKLKSIAGNDFNDYAKKLAIAYAKEWRSCGCSQNVKEEIDNAILMSNVKKHLRETKNQYPIDPIKEMELSTQFIIKSALEKGIDVEILDRKEHFIRLIKGNLKETIKNATCTSKDSYVNILMKGSKSLTKRLLKEKDIRVPNGVVYHSIDEAMEGREKLPYNDVVIKPNSTNMGIGIHFINKNEESFYKAALKDAFKHEDQVIVEEFIKGEEYRFLVIDFKVVAISNRIPANVVGNGKDTIETLIEEKNKTKIEKGKIKGIDDPDILGKIVEKGILFKLRKQSNVSTGGDAVDMTDCVDSTYSKLAVEAAKALNSKICGVDMIIETKDETASNKNYAIIELNYNPALFMHSHPDQGTPRDVATPIFKLLNLL